jgi:hypothetical protein
VGGAKGDGVGQPVQGLQQLADLVVGVGRGHLDAEADPLAGHARVEGEGDVDALLQQEPPGPGQVVGVGQEDLDDREAGAE